MQCCGPAEPAVNEWASNDEVLCCGPAEPAVNEWASNDETQLTDSHQLCCDTTDGLDEFIYRPMICDPTGTQEPHARTMEESRACTAHSVQEPMALLAQTTGRYTYSANAHARAGPDRHSSSLSLPKTFTAWPVAPRSALPHSTPNDAQRESTDDLAAHGRALLPFRTRQPQAHNLRRTGYP